MTASYSGRPTGSVNRNLDLGDAAWRGCSYGRRYRWKPVPDEPPSALTEDDDRDLSMRQILLVAHVSIRREEHIESRSFCGVQQFAVPERIPAVRAAFLDGVTR